MCQTLWCFARTAALPPVSAIRCSKTACAIALAKSAARLSRSSRDGGRRRAGLIRAVAEGCFPTASATRTKEHGKTERTLQNRDNASLDEGVQLHEPHGCAQNRKGSFEHGCRSRSAEQPEGLRSGDDGAFDHSRSKARYHESEEIHRGLQAAHGDAR